MSQELLKIENLTKRYDDNTVLQSINMTVRQGEVVVITQKYTGIPSG